MPLEEPREESAPPSDGGGPAPLGPPLPAPAGPPPFEDGTRWVVSEPGLFKATGSPVPAGAVMATWGGRGVAEIHGDLLPVQLVPDADICGYAALKGSAYELASRGADGALTDLGTRLGLLAAGAPPRGTDTPPAAAVGPEDPGDVRTLWVDTDPQQGRYKSWRSVVYESFPASYSDSPVEGPSSAMHILRHSERHGGNIRMWLDVWARSKNIGSSERVYHELSVLCETLYVGGTYDQLNMPSLVSFEVIARRIQSIVDAYSGDPSRPQRANARLYSGVGSALDMVAPDLKHYVAKKAKDEAEVESMRTRARNLPLTADALAAGGLLGAGNTHAAGGPKGQPKGPKGVSKGKTTEGPQPP